MRGQWANSLRRGPSLRQHTPSPNRGDCVLSPLVSISREPQLEPTVTSRVADAEALVEAEMAGGGDTSDDADAWILPTRAALVPSRDPLPRLQPARGLSARILFLVVLLVAGSSASAWLILTQERHLLGQLRLLTGVYVPFHQRLARARESDVQLRKFRVQELSRDEPRRSGSSDLLLRAAMENRGRLVRELREPLEQAFNPPDRFTYAQLAPLRALLQELARLESLVDEDEIAVELDRADERENETVSRVNRIDGALRALDAQAVEALRAHDDAVQRAGARAEQYTWLVTVASLALGALTAFAASWTLRPLRQLTERVRRLGAGDWSQRIGVTAPAARDNEVMRLGREFDLMAEALWERERRLIHSERMAAIGQMAAQITHEIRNPLSSVALNAELLGDELEEAGAGPDTTELLARVITEVDRLAQITESYLSFARRSAPEFETIDLAEQLEDLLDFLHNEHERSGIKVHRELGEPGCAWIRGDPKQLRQAFLNLLRNAQDAVLEWEANSVADTAETRAPEISVQVRCKPNPKPEVQVVIRDSGTGIAGSESEWQRIFEPFVTHKAQGTGLGLPMVQQIVAAHGGSVSVLSTGPEGTRFGLVFPACQGPGRSVSSQNSSAGRG